MKIKELIQRLQEFNPELEVRVSTDWSPWPVYAVVGQTRDYPQTDREVPMFVEIQGG